MRKSFKFILAILLISPLVRIQAQQDNEEKSALKTTFLATPVGSNWFLSISGGGGVLMAEESRYMNLVDRIKPTVGLSFGKWISPVWGFRVNLTGAQLIGFTTWNEEYGGLGDWYIGKNHPFYTDGSTNSTNTYIHAYGNPAAAQVIKDRYLNVNSPYLSKEGPGYTYDVPYVAGSIDFLLNLNYLLGAKYKEDRFFHVDVYGGLGLAHTLLDDKRDRTHINSLMERFGLTFNFRLGSAVNLFLDGHGMILPEVFDWRVGDGNTQDIITNVSLGLTFNFKGRSFTKATLCDPQEIDALNDEINNLRDQLAAVPAPVPCPDCPKCPECPECPKQVVDIQKTPIVRNNLTFLPTPVFFRINSSVIDNDQWISIQKAAEYLKENPDKRIKVTGYADKKTGTPAINRKLSENRAQAVFNAMVNKYGIASSRIQTNFLGDTVQPFDENDWNRVVVFVIP